MLIPKLELNKTQTLRCGLNNPRKAAWCAPGYLTKPTPRAARPGRQRAALTWARGWSSSSRAMAAGRPRRQLGHGAHGQCQGQAGPRRQLGHGARGSRAPLRTGRAAPAPLGSRSGRTGPFRVGASAGGRARAPPLSRAPQPAAGVARTGPRRHKLPHRPSRRRHFPPVRPGRGRGEGGRCLPAPFLPPFPPSL